jgi:arginase family enzyme
MSGKPKGYWSARFPVVQVWADEIAGKESESVQMIISSLAAHGVLNVYISNDIDGTDVRFASATCAPETNGLTPSFVSALTQALQRRFTLIGGDIVEVAPPLSGMRDYGKEETCILAADYLHALLWNTSSPGTRIRRLPEYGPQSQTQGPV